MSDIEEGCVCNIGVQECPVHPGNLKTKEEKIAFRKAWDETHDIKAARDRLLEQEKYKKDQRTPVDPPLVDCVRCDGCGKIANDDEGTPWTAWLSLPVGSAAAVLLGLVKPISCPECNGVGRVVVLHRPRQSGKAAEAAARADRP